MPFPDAQVSWTLDTPGQLTDEDLLILQDGDAVNCIDMKSLSSRQLLRGHVTQSFITAVVQIASITNDTIQYGQPDDPSSCFRSVLPSQVMVHEGPTRGGSPCKMFCSPPVPCAMTNLYQGTGSQNAVHVFACTCPVWGCHEILLWLDSNSSKGSWKVCEVIFHGENTPVGLQPAQDNGVIIEE